MCLFATRIILYKQETAYRTIPNVYHEMHGFICEGALLPLKYIAFIAKLLNLFAPLFWKMFYRVSQNVSSDQLKVLQPDTVLTVGRFYHKYTKIY